MYKYITIPKGCHTTLKNYDIHILEFSTFLCYNSWVHKCFSQHITMHSERFIIYVVYHLYLPQFFRKRKKCILQEKKRME